MRDWGVFHDFKKYFIHSVFKIHENMKSLSRHDVQLHRGTIQTSWPLYPFPVVAVTGRPFGLMRTDIEGIPVLHLHT